MLTKLAHYIRKKIRRSSPPPFRLSFRMTVMAVPSCETIDVRLHPGEDALGEYMFKTGCPEEHEAIETHLEYCAHCNIVLKRLESDMFKRLMRDIQKHEDNDCDE